MWHQPENNLYDFCSDDSEEFGSSKILPPILPLDQIMAPTDTTTANTTNTTNSTTTATPATPSAVSTVVSFSYLILCRKSEVRDHKVVIIYSFSFCSHQHQQQPQ